MEKKTAVIIAAAGSGKRMGGGIPKLYRMMGGMPVLARTLKVFSEHPGVCEICIVAKDGEQEFCRREIVERYGIQKVTSIVAGGAERQDSVYQALTALTRDVDCVLVQDGARPFVTERIITDLIHELSEHSAAVSAVPSKDTIKMVSPELAVTGTPDRSKLFCVQTPQGFRRDVLEKAYEQAFSEQFYGTDDAVLVERIGETVYLVKGDYSNIKITTSEDLFMGEAILNARGEGADGRMPIRIGTGFDVHAFTEGRPLILGGIQVPYHRGLLGHSDADVLVHAVMDAMLGACGLGDIGRHFPDTDPQYKGVSSLKLLLRVRDLVREQGFETGNIDATLIAQQPKLASYLDQMAEKIGGCLGMPKDQQNRVSVKATTTEHLGFTGREEGIAAQASVLLYRI